MSNALLGFTLIATVPMPSFNMINGGRYGELVQPFNEFVVTPYRADLLVEQNAPAALSVANYRYVFEVGKTVVENTGQELLVDENVRKTYLGGLASRSYSPLRGRALDLVCPAPALELACQ